MKLVLLLLVCLCALAICEDGGEFLKSVLITDESVITFESVRYFKHRFAPMIYHSI